MVRFATAALIFSLILVSRPAAAGNTMLLDFASPTCGPCQQMIPTIRSLEEAGYPVRRVDVTREPQLAQQFGVDRVPCFVMLEDGREVGRILGATSREQLERMFNSRVRSQSPEAAFNQPPSQSNSPDSPQTFGGPMAASTPPESDPWTGVSVPGGGTAGKGPRSAPSAMQGDAEPPGDSIAADLIASTVRLRVEDAEGRSYGTGTIIDARSGEALVITCGHLFRESNGKGPVTVELFAATPEGVRVVGQAPGEVVGYNLDRDLGLVSIRPNQPVRVAPIAPTHVIIDRGERVTSVGCDHGDDPTALATRVTAVNRYQGPPNIEAGGAPVEGRSGGGLFNNDGQLVGVCFAADYEGNEGLYTALESIHDELDRVGLTEIYQSPASSPASDAFANQSPTAAPPTATPPIVRGQEPPQPVMPLASEPPVSPASMAGSPLETHPANQATSQLSAAERAAWSEIMARADESEVICIIRPKDPGGKSEVITLNGMSGDFVRALADRTSVGAANITR